MLFGLNRIMVSDLKCQIEDLKKENEKLQYACDAYKKRLEGEMATASYAINWDTMNAFSVERMWENGLPKTVIGYLLSEPIVTTTQEGSQLVTDKDIVREWTLYCSAEKHEQLIREFVEWKGK